MTRCKNCEGDFAELTYVEATIKESDYIIKMWCCKPCIKQFGFKPIIKTIERVER